jgi:hypothetical protein
VHIDEDVKIKKQEASKAKGRRIGESFIVPYIDMFFPSIYRTEHITWDSYFLACRNHHRYFGNVKLGNCGLIQSQLYTAMSWLKIFVVFTSTMFLLTLFFDAQVRVIELYLGNYVNTKELFFLLVSCL